MLDGVYLCTTQSRTGEPCYYSENDCLLMNYNQSSERETMRSRFSSGVTLSRCNGSHVKYDEYSIQIKFKFKLFWDRTPLPDIVHIQMNLFKSSPPNRDRERQTGSPARRRKL